MSGDPDEPPLRLRLFGRFSAWVDGEPLRPLASRKGQWLLALLALGGGKLVEREWLLAQLWPESDEPRAYRNLRQTLYDLRRALGPAALLLESPTVAPCACASTAPTWTSLPSTPTLLAVPSSG